MITTPDFFINNNYSFPVISKIISKKQFIINAIIILWDNLSSELKLEQLTSTFKRKLKTLLNNTLQISLPMYLFIY